MCILGYMNFDLLLVQNYDLFRRFDAHFVSGADFEKYWADHILHIPYIPAYSATPCIIRVKIWGLGLPEKRLPLCIIRPQILDVSSVPVGSVTGHLNVRHGYYLILLNSPATPVWTMLNDGKSGNSTALQNQRAVPAHL